MVGTAVNLTRRIGARTPTNGRVWAQVETQVHDEITGGRHDLVGSLLRGTNALDASSSNLPSNMDGTQEEQDAATKVEEEKTIAPILHRVMSTEQSLSMFIKRIAREWVEVSLACRVRRVLCGCVQRAGGAAGARLDVTHAPSLGRRWKRARRK